VQTGSTCKNCYFHLDKAFCAQGFFTDSLLVINNFSSRGLSKWGEKAVNENVTILPPNLTKVASS
jgi:hypothetical protein